MFSDDELLQLNKEGWLVGPGETVKKYYNRIKTSKDFFISPQKFSPPISINKKIFSSQYNWVYAHLHSVFDIVPEEIFSFFSTQKLSFFEGGVTWSFAIDDQPIPLVQIHEKMERKKLWGIYSVEETLAHELVHAARIAFDDPKTEEFLAYMTSTSLFRRIFGPLFSSQKEITIMFLCIVFFALSQFCQGIFSYFSFLSLILKTIIGVMGGFFIWRLFYRRHRFTRCLKKCIRLANDAKKGRSILLRLTDREILMFSSMSMDKIKDYISSVCEKDLRWKVIVFAYLNEKNI